MRKQPPGRGEQDPLYQCSQCSRRYHRTEHLVRHVRSHTKQRPYSCAFCSKTFARRDVLKRHEVMHSHDEPRLNPSSAVAVRVSQACRPCAATKSKCSDQKPCHRCVAKDLDCTYPDDPEDSIHQTQDQAQHQMPNHNQNDQPEMFPDGEFQEQPDAVATDPSPNPQRDMDDPSATLHAFLGPMDLPDLFDLSAQDPLVAEGFSFGPDWDLGPIDFSSLQAQFDAPDAINMMPDMSTADTTAEHPEALSVTGSWEPQHSENGEMERPNLAAGEEGFRVPRLSQSPNASALTMSLSTPARDNILSMILNTTSQANAAQIVTAFPCTETLNMLIRNCAQDQRAAYINGILHLPTLELNQQRPELLGAMVAVGASNAGTTVARKFGYAMQEVIRASSFRSWEEDNTAFRDIGLAQGFYLQQYMAFFSGVRRKIALAEACSKCIQVIIKNGLHLRGALENDNDKLLDLAGLDHQSLDRAWRQWSVRESQRRLCYAAYIMDAHVSFSHGTQVISSYMDMKIPLPAPRRLWTAETCTRWRDEMLLLEMLPRPQRPLCLKDVIGDPALLAMHRDLFDVDFANLGLLAGLWALIKECHQLSSLGHTSTWSSLLLSSRRAELLSVLKLFGSEALSASSSPEAELLYEAVSMHALITPDSFLLPELTSLLRHGKAVIPSSVHHPRLAGSVEYRAALWRIGRMIRAASRCPTGTLCDVYAIALFHAAIILWWHGIALSQQGLGLDRRSHVCILDSDDSHEHQMLSRDVRLALLGPGPGMEPILLENPSDVMERLREILGHNWRDSQMPTGVQEISYVLTNLGNAAHNYELELD